MQDYMSCGHLNAKLFPAYEAYGCLDCDTWMTISCGCTKCKSRPEKPSMAKLKKYLDKSFMTKFDSTNDFWKSSLVVPDIKTTFSKKDFIGEWYSPDAFNLSKYASTPKYVAPAFNSDYLKPIDQDTVTALMCAQCGKQPDTVSSYNDYAKNIITVNIQCHGEILAVSLSFELVKDINSEVNALLYATNQGLVFSNTQVRKETLDAVYNLRYRCYQQPVETNALAMLRSQLTVLAMNSSEALNIVRAEHKKCYAYKMAISFFRQQLTAILQTVDPLTKPQPFPTLFTPDVPF
jgi:hypothetical protein